MKLISEQVDNVGFITETTENGKKAHYLVGPFIQTEIVNRNGRLYQKSMMESVVSKYNDDKVSKSSAYGELNHAQGATINLDRVCILIKELNWNGNDVIGKARITETPMGNIVKGLLESGGQVGVSTRGLGDLEKRSDGIMLVKPGYYLATAADVVSDPSAPSAWVKGIMEGVEYFYDEMTESWIQEKIYEQKAAIHKMSLQEIEDNKLKLFEDFIKTLSK